MPLLDRTVRIGLNYTPGVRWYYFWNDFRPAEVAADFQAMAALGIDHVRIQLIWPWFMPNPGWVSPGHLDRLDQLLGIAEDVGVDVLVSVLTGFLSGYVFLPWGMTGRDVFTQPKAIEQEKILLRAVLDRACRHRNFMGIDLGNEINCLDHDLAPEIGDQWAGQMIATIHSHAPDTPVVNGVDHTPWMAGSTFSTRSLAQDYAACCLHIWPKFTGCLEKGPLSGPPASLLTAFFVQLAAIKAGRPEPFPGQAAKTESTPDTPNLNAKPIWVQEVGCCDLWGEPSARQAFMTAAFGQSFDHGASLLTWWCSHDKTADLRFNQQEYHYGLLTPDNRPKDLAGLFSELVRAYRKPSLPNVTNTGHKTAKPSLDDLPRLILPDDFEPRIVRPWPKGQWLEQNFASNTWDVFTAFVTLAEQRSAMPQLFFARDAGQVRSGDVVIAQA